MGQSRMQIDKKKCAGRANETKFNGQCSFGFHCLRSHKLNYDVGRM